MLSSSGNTTCWGVGLESPVANAVGKTFTSIEHGDAYVCGLDAARSAWCWGANDLGKLGIGTEVYQTTPQAVLGGQQFLKLSGFYTFACGINVGNALWCWGHNHMEQIDNSGSNRLVPTSLATTLRFTDVSVGLYYGCALATTGSMYCWGKEVSGSSALVEVMSAHRFTAIAVTGGVYICGIRMDKQVVCASSANDATGRVIEGLSNAERLEGFEGNTCAITTDRSVYCWGDNQFGQLGDPALPLGTSSWTRAVRVSGISSAVSIGGSYDTPCAALSNGTVSCWGFNANGEAGQPAPRVPRTVTGGLTFKGP
jgi:alpha-tubulin suppressor-like RCC1 family protein